MKLFAEIELDKPLMRGTYMKLEDEHVWVEFTHEYLPAFCFYCGCLGHQEKSYAKKLTDSKIHQIFENQYEDWMRAKRSKEGRTGNRQKEEKRGLIIASKGSEGESVRGGTQRKLDRSGGNGNQVGVLECELGGMKGWSQVSK